MRRTWYIANDFQFFLLVPPLLALYCARGRAAGWAALLTAWLFNVFASWYTSAKFDLNITIFDPKYQRYFYAVPWCRIGVYACGAALGLVWHERSARESKRKHEQEAKARKESAPRIEASTSEMKEASTTAQSPSMEGGPDPESAVKEGATDVADADSSVLLLLSSSKTSPLLDPPAAQPDARPCSVAVDIGPAPPWNIRMALYLASAGLLLLVLLLPYNDIKSGSLVDAGSLFGIGAGPSSQGKGWSQQQRNAWNALSRPGFGFFFCRLSARHVNRRSLLAAGVPRRPSMASAG